jgi:hypothetical protein
VTHRPDTQRALVEIDGVNVILAPDTPVRRALSWMWNRHDRRATMGPNRLRIIVQDVSSGKVMWVNHGAKPIVQAERRFEQVCGEIERVGLDRFLHHHRRRWHHGAESPRSR